MVGSVLAGTATGSVITGGTKITLLHDSASDRPISYTPVCVGGASFRVCVHPACQEYLSRAVTSFDLVMSELAGLPGAPVRAVEVSDHVLPAVVLDQGGNGVVTGTPPVYEFIMDNAVALGFAGIGLIFSLVTGGLLAWTGPLSFMAICQFALIANYSEPLTWAARPATDRGGWITAMAVFAISLAAYTIRGPRVRPTGE